MLKKHTGFFLPKRLLYHYFIISLFHCYPLMNITPFYQAFSVLPGELNYKPDSERIKIW